MPIEGYYFCSMACVHEYNSWIADMVETEEVMPDDGPGNADPQSFLMPARTRPNALIELSPDELCDEGDQQLEGEESHAHGKQQHTRAHALRTKIPRASILLPRTRVCLANDAIDVGHAECPNRGHGH